LALDTKNGHNHEGKTLPKWDKKICAFCGDHKLDGECEHVKETANGIGQNQEVECFMKVPGIYLWSVNLKLN
jgi:hypothetical protein